MAKRCRLDLLLVERGLTPTREQARALVLAGGVRLNGAVAATPGTAVPDTAVVEIVGQDHPYASRGGLKLERALHSFQVNPQGGIALDVGASTGGFTDCLLQHGATKVYAVDVGYGQLAWKLRQDDRVVVLERTNFRHLAYEAIGEAVDLVVIDASFISLKLLLPKVREFLAPWRKQIFMSVGWTNSALPPKPWGPGLSANANPRFLARKVAIESSSCTLASLEGFRRG